MRGSMPIDSNTGTVTSEVAPVITLTTLVAKNTTLSRANSERDIATYGFIVLSALLRCGTIALRKLHLATVSLSMTNRRAEGAALSA
jgi:hypothetical protein